MGMEIGASELLKAFVFDVDPLATLARAGILDEGKAASPSDQFVDKVLSGLMGAQSAGIPTSEFRTRMQLISAAVTPALWKLEVHAGERLQRYLREALAKEGSEPPPSRLGERTLADLLDGRIAGSEFGLIIKHHANALFSRLTILSSLQRVQRMGASDQGVAGLEEELKVLRMIDIGRLFFYAAQARDLYPETYPEVATLAGVLILRPRFDPEMNDAARERQARAYANLKRKVGEQLGLAWISRVLSHEFNGIFFGEDGRRIVNPEVVRLEKMIRAATLMGSGLVPSPSDFNDRYEWTRAIVKLIARAKFDEGTVIRAFGDALKFLPDRFGWAISLRGVYGDRAAGILSEPPLDALTRARKFDLMSRDHESRGDMTRAAIRCHMAAKELIRVTWLAGPQQQFIASASRALLLRAGGLYTAAADAMRAAAERGDAPAHWQDHLGALHHRGEEVSNDITSAYYYLKKNEPPIGRPVVDIFSTVEDESPLSTAVVNVAQYQVDEQTAPAVEDEDVEQAFSRVMETDEAVAAGEIPFTPVPACVVGKP